MLALGRSTLRYTLTHTLIQLSRDQTLLDNAVLNMNLTVSCFTCRWMHGH